MSAGYAWLIDVSPQIQVLDELISFPMITPGSTIDSNDFGDYFRMTVDRSQTITPSKLIVWIEFNAVLGQQMELTVAGVESSSSAGISGDLLAEGQSDFTDLSALAGHWLWTGTTGEIQEDLVPDGTVNLADFAEFAENWKR